WETVAEAIGIRRSRLFQLLGTEKLPESAREDIRAGRLSEKQSRALQGLLPGHQEALRAAIVADDLSAAEAMRLARSLRAAHLPDDVAAATAALATLRTQPSSPATTAPDEIAALIAALAAAASDSGADRAALSRLADAIDAPAYDRDRLQTEIEALVRTLARTPPRELRTSGSAYAPLVALHGALAALLSDH
nr:stage 0 sporulation protein J [Chloroflexia bacterium]